MLVFVVAVFCGKQEYNSNRRRSCIANDNVVSLNQLKRRNKIRKCFVAFTNLARLWWLVTQVCHFQYFVHSECLIWVLHYMQCFMTTIRYCYLKNRSKFLLKIVFDDFRRSCGRTVLSIAACLAVLVKNFRYSLYTARLLVAAKIIFRIFW